MVTNTHAYYKEIKINMKMKKHIKSSCNTALFWGILVSVIMVTSACSHAIFSTKKANEHKKTASSSTQETPAPTPTGTPFVFASMAEKVDPLIITGKCGENANWTYNTHSQLLTISGTGVVDQMIKKSDQYLTDGNQKAKYRVKEIRIEEGITALDAGPLFLRTCRAKGMKEIKISLPDSLEKIGTNTFDPGQPSCVYFRHIHLPKNVRYIEDGAFWGLGDEACPQAYTYEEDIKYLSKHYKKSLKITVDKDNPYYTVIDNVIFTKDKKTLVYYPSEKTDKIYQIPKSVTKIEALAFARNSFVYEIILPTNLKVMGAGAFFRDHRLRTINLHEAHKIKKLEDFNGQSRSLYNGDGRSGYPKWVRYHAPLDDLTSDEEDRYNNPRTTDYHMMGTFGGTDLREIQFPDNLKYAAFSTFDGCVNLEKITLGKSFAGGFNPISYLDKKGFVLPLEQSTDKFDIQIPNENKHFKIINNVLYSRDGKTVYGITKFYQGTTLTLDKSVKIITRNAFANTRLKKVTVLGNLKLIANAAFMYCSRLRSFEVKGNIDTIGIEAFYYCEKLKKVICHGKIKTIGAKAFYSDSSLQGFPTAENDVQSIGEDAFPDKSNIIQFTDN